VVVDRRAEKAAFVSKQSYCELKAVQGATPEYPATVVPDSTCAHIFKERDMCRNKLTQVAGYSAVKLVQESSQTV